MNEQYYHFANNCNLDLKEITDAKTQEIEDLKARIELLKDEHRETLNELKFKLKDKKHEVEELKLKLKHCESKFCQKSDHYEQVINDLKVYHLNEIEEM